MTYFDRVGTTIDDMRSESIEATPPAGRITRDGVMAVNESRRAAAAALDELVPPDEVVPEHLALVTALEDLVRAVDAFLDGTADSTDESFVDAVNSGSELQRLAGRVGMACDSLERRAAELGVAADIRC